MIQATLQHDAGWYYRTGNELYERKYFLDAQVMFDRACRLEPENTEYATARKRLQILAASLGDWFSKKVPDPYNSGSDFCTEFCCECCGECCAEGCPEVCAEFCSNCDCDCDCG